MTCQHCVGEIKKAFERVDGVNNVEIVLEKGQAHISYDSYKLDMEKLKNALDETNYLIAD